MNRGQIQIERARTLMSWGRDAEAEAELRGALAVDPDNAWAHALLGLVLLRLDRPHDAWTACQTSLGLAPDDASGHWVMSWLYLHEGHPDAAEEAATRAIELEPNWSPLYAQLARCRAANGCWKQALSAADQGLAYDAHDNECLKLRLEAIRQLGETKLLDDASHAALGNDPEDSEAFAYAGWCAMQKGNRALAKAHFVEAIRLDPENENAHHGLRHHRRASNVAYRTLLKWSLGNRLRRYLIAIALILLVLAVRESFPATNIWTSTIAGLIALWAHAVLIFAMIFEVP